MRGFSHSTLLLATYLVSLFYALHFALPLYIESSYLSVFLAEKWLGLLYALSSIFGGIFVIYIAEHLNRFTNYRTTIVFMVAEIIALIGLAFSGNTFLSAGLFVVHQMLLTIIYVTLNIYLEELSSDRETGGIRGVFLTILNLGILVAPLIAGFIFAEDAFRSVFLMSAFLLVPALILTMLILHDVKEPRYKRVHAKRALRDIIRNSDLRNIFLCQFLLELFYAIMVIYGPIHLSHTVGIPLEKVLGIIMPFALLPFVIFPYELGRLADSRLGEKEILTTGFIIIGIFTLFIPFVESTSLVVWALLLFATRVGASFIESMASVYFYKKIDGRDSSVIALFNSTRVAALLVAPVAASIALIFFPTNALFLGLGVLMFFGTQAALAIEDTK